VATNVGSWRFIIGQWILFVIWIAVNTLHLFDVIRFDPYPFFFFNLFMSCEAAFATPIIMISQNRQNEHDRHSAEVAHRRGMEALELARLTALRSGVSPEEVLAVREHWNEPDEKAG
jgi:uncharacterized membrane protein